METPFSLKDWYYNPLSGVKTKTTSIETTWQSSVHLHMSKRLLYAGKLFTVQKNVVGTRAYRKLIMKARVKNYLCRICEEESELWTTCSGSQEISGEGSFIIVLITLSDLGIVAKSITASLYILGLPIIWFKLCWSTTFFKRARCCGGLSMDFRSHILPDTRTKLRRVTESLPLSLFPTFPPFLHFIISIWRTGRTVLFSTLMFVANGRVSMLACRRSYCHRQLDVFLYPS